MDERHRTLRQAVEWGARPIDLAHDYNWPGCLGVSPFAGQDKTIVRHSHECHDDGDADDGDDDDDHDYFNNPCWLLPCPGVCWMWWNSVDFTDSGGSCPLWTSPWTSPTRWIIPRGINLITVGPPKREQVVSNNKHLSAPLCQGWAVSFSEGELHSSTNEFLLSPFPFKEDDHLESIRNLLVT